MCCENYIYIKNNVCVIFMIYVFVCCNIFFYILLYSCKLVFDILFFNFFNLYEKKVIILIFYICKCIENKEE